jgi:hypothetical protein
VRGIDRLEDADGGTRVVAGKLIHGRVCISRCCRIEDRTMLAMMYLAYVFHGPAVERSIAFGMIEKLTNRLRYAVMNSANEPLVKCAVGDANRQSVRDTKVVFMLGEQAFELSNIGRLEQRNGYAGCRGLERDAHHVQALGVVTGQLSDLNTMIRFENGQALALQNSQSFPDWIATHTELSGESHLRGSRPRRYLSAEDGIVKLSMDLRDAHTIARGRAG